MSSRSHRLDRLIHRYLDLLSPLALGQLQSQGFRLLAAAGAPTRGARCRGAACLTPGEVTP